MRFNSGPCASLSKMRRALSFALSLLFVGSALAQAQPDIAAMLKQVGDIYKAASQYQFAMNFTSHDPATGADSVSQFMLAFKAPDKYRVQGAIPGPGAGVSGAGEAISVYDGSAVWFYMPGANQYGTFPASVLAGDAPGDLADLRPEAMDSFMMWRYRGAGEFVDSARFLGEETIEFAGAKVSCYVLTVIPEPKKPPYTWWIDKTSHHILREKP
jgi:hypothetical protein